MKRWKIYYDDFSTFSNEDGEPEDAPKTGVIAVITEDAKHGRFIANGYDYYWQDADGWGGGDIFGLWDYLSMPGLKCPLFGRTLPKEEFQAVVDFSMNDPFFGEPKKLWEPNEKNRISQ